MNEVTKNGNGFVGYEYKSVTAKRCNAELLADSYPSFGWSLEGASTPIGSINSVNMRFKRDRKIRNKAELTRLQRQFESQLDEIETMEISKTLGASIAAYTIGILGTAFMAGSVFAFLADMVALCIILAVPGFIGWAAAYLSYVNIRKKKTEKLVPIIDGKYDEIFEVCERANSLLAS
ncbi:MAG: hypothetical protein FWE65_03880 [Eggerthellaceae bacterium]|nr:hypothetical protein [Eggerthellaceae bacterium]